MKTLTSEARFAMHVAARYVMMCAYHERYVDWYIAALRSDFAVQERRRMRRGRRG